MRSVRELPFKMPHFVNDVLARAPVSQQQIFTTVDSSLQRIVEKSVRRYIARKQASGVQNAAVLIVDSRDMKVKALLGSVDFFNKSIGGQIDGTAI